MIMKKQLLVIAGSLLSALALQAQVTVYVQQPPSLEGPLDFTWADNWGQTPNLNDTSFTAFACFVDDGTAADSLGCNPLVNGSQLMGKFAVVYRGSCEFGAKAMNAQNAGAIGCIIINNAAGAPVGMGAGAQGANVTIPVVMISQDAGAALRDELLNCNVEFFIGSQTGYYANNLAISKNDILIPRYGAVSSIVAANASEFSMQVGGMIHNYGQNDMNNARLHCVITQDGSNVVYDQTSAGAVIIAEDSLYVTLPDFSQSSYSGSYEIVYSVLDDIADDFPDNNAISASLTIGEVITYAPGNATTHLPAPNLHVIAANNTTGMRSCMYFSDPNASRLAATGLWFSADRAADQVLTDEIVTGTLYQWTDAITDQVTLPSDVGLLSITSGEYVFDSDLVNTPIYLPFLENIELINNQNYLVCLDSYSGIVRHGWDNSLNYDRTQTLTLLPATMIRVDGTWYNGWTGITGPASLGLQVVDVNTIGIVENESIDVTPFPNPTAENIRIPLKDLAGKVDVRVFDMAGHLVMERRAATAGADGLVVDVKGLVNGTYLFRLGLEDGRTTEFRVQVNK